MKDKDAVPTNAEHASLRQFLQNKSFTPAQVNAAVGATHGNRTRRKIAQDLITWLRSRPKGP